MPGTIEPSCSSSSLSGLPITAGIISRVTRASRADGDAAPRHRPAAGSARNAPRDEVRHEAGRLHRREPGPAAAGMDAARGLRPGDTTRRCNCGAAFKSPASDWRC